jgi:hypothetical protein
LPKIGAGKWAKEPKHGLYNDECFLGGGGCGFGAGGGGVGFGSFFRTGGSGLSLSFQPLDMRYPPLRIELTLLILRDYFFRFDLFFEVDFLLVDVDLPPLFFFNLAFFFAAFLKRTRVPPALPGRLSPDRSSSIQPFDMFSTLY